MECLYDGIVGCVSGFVGVWAGALPVCHMFELSCAMWAESVFCTAHEPEFVFGGKCACVCLEEALAVCVIEFVCCLRDSTFDVLSGEFRLGHEVFWLCAGLEYLYSPLRVECQWWICVGLCGCEPVRVAVRPSFASVSACSLRMAPA
eukprot:2796163-Rhodomonas_salina.1